MPKFKSKNKKREHKKKIVRDEMLGSVREQIRRVNFFYRADNEKGIFWEEKIRVWLKNKYPRLEINKKNPDVIIVLGGDGTILEAARNYVGSAPLFFGLNLGQVGFLAAVRSEKNFFPGLKKLFTNRYWVEERMMLQANVKRGRKTIFRAYSLNDILIENPLGMVKMEVSIDGYPFQYIEGTGALVATSTGSTAINLSAHGPIVMPSIKCLILTEILDHNIPTPSIVVKYNRKIVLKVLSFRERGLLVLKKSGKAAEVLLVSDGEKTFPIQKNDIITVSGSPRLVKFAEIEKNYFLKSLQEKFAFR